MMMRTVVKDQVMVLHHQPDQTFVENIQLQAEPAQKDITSTMNEPQLVMRNLFRLLIIINPSTPRINPYHKCPTVLEAKAMNIMIPNITSMKSQTLWRKKQKLQTLRKLTMPNLHHQLFLLLES